MLPVVPLDPTAPQRRRAYDPRHPLLLPFVPRANDIAAGRTTPRDLLEQAIARIDADEPAIRAFVCHDLAAARHASDAATARWRAGQPLSPVDGMPIVVKDMIATAGLPTQMNSPIFEGWDARVDAACVFALREAGAVVLGKTVTTEFACGNSGPTRNPYDTARTPGGSSSGSSAAVGAGMAALGFGTQTHGSTIRPAGYCGAYALKPTHGALHVGGLAPLAATLDHLGLIGASLEDVWAAGMAISRIVGGTPPHPGMAGPQTAPSPRRPATLVRLDTLGWAETPPASRDAFENAVARLGAAGVRILDADSDAEVAALEVELSGIGDFANDLLAWEARWPLAAYRAQGEDMVGARIHDLLARAARVDRAAYARALADRQRLRDRVAGFAGRANGFVMLCSSGPAIADHGFTGSRNYALPWTLVGAPAFALPLLVADDLPLGLQVAGFAERDAEACAIAGWVRDTLLTDNA
ncbi:amidase [Roseomonas fluvialis]|uniref:Amidase n=1 Tax=Roseomonas fluvialis TaxID=1750527 RepID=A0ABN6P708_9PROT|nr:amidase [Roseomonas fluvialis]BDG74271.1 amidase [Roseomonas fluvialis]